MKRLFVSTLIAAGITSMPAHALMIGFSSAGGGQVDIVVSDIGDQVVSSFGIQVTYDDTALNVLSAAVGDPAGNLSDPGDATSARTFLSAGLGGSTLSMDPALPAVVLSPGMVELAEVSFEFDADLVLSQPDSFILGNIVFDSDPDLAGLAFLWNVDKEIDIKGLRALVIVPGNDVEVPEPGALLLLGTGLLGFVATRSRRSRRRANAS